MTAGSTTLMRPGVDSYSYHRLFGEIRPGEADPGERWSQWDLLDEMERIGARAVSLETCFFPDDHGFWGELGAELDRRNFDCALAWGAPRGLMRGTDEAASDDLGSTIEHAVDLEAEVLRIVIGGPADLFAEPEREVIDRLVPLLEQHLDRADALGVSVAVETHCDLSLAALDTLVEQLDGRLGVVLDTANVVRIGEDLLSATERLADHVRMLHVKDLDLGSASDLDDPAGWWPSVVLGTGDLDLGSALGVLDRAGFSGWACVEVADVPPGSDERSIVAQSLEWLRARSVSVAS